MMRRDFKPFGGWATAIPRAPASWVAPRHRGSRMPRFVSGIEFDLF